ncbi:hypothetical protein BDV11DRAFT_191758 [Aspergillus similis]
MSWSLTDTGLDCFVLSFLFFQYTFLLCRSPSESPTTAIYYLSGVTGWSYYLLSWVFIFHVRPYLLLPCSCMISLPHAC